MYLRHALHGPHYIIVERFSKALPTVPFAGSSGRPGMLRIACYVKFVEFASQCTYEDVLTQGCTCVRMYLRGCTYEDVLTWGCTYEDVLTWGCTYARMYLREDVLTKDVLRQCTYDNVPTTMYLRHLSFSQYDSLGGWAEKLKNGGFSWF